MKRAVFQFWIDVSGIKLICLSVTGLNKSVRKRITASFVPLLPPKACHYPAADLDPVLSWHQLLHIVFTWRRENEQNWKVRVGDAPKPVTFYKKKNLTTATGTLKKKKNICFVLTRCEDQKGKEKKGSRSAWLTCESRLKRQCGVSGDESCRFPPLRRKHRQQ